MGRPRKRSLFPVALSIDSAAVALDIPRRAVADAVASGAVEAFKGPGKRIRIPVAGLVDWLRTWPRANKRSKS